MCHTRGKVADVMLRFSWPKPFDRTMGQKGERGEEEKKEIDQGRKKGRCDGDWGLSSIQEISTGQWKEKESNFSL